MARTKIDRRILKTKRAIVCALLRLQKQNNHDKITVTELTDAADINRKTFYLHYKSVADVSDQFTEHWLDRIRESVAASRSPQTGISAETLFQMFQEHIETYSDIFHALFVRDILPAYLSRIQDALISDVTEALRSTHACGIDELRSRVIYATAGAVSLYLDWSTHAGSKDLTALTRTMTQMTVKTFDGSRG